MALQLSVLQSGKQVINLDVKKVHRYMEEQPFSEVCVYGKSLITVFFDGICIGKLLFVMF